MEKIFLSKEQARRFILIHQGLWPPRAARGKNAVLDYIKKAGCIQFDPLNIAGCNHELVLQARISDFKPEMLQTLLYKERKLIDGWDKNMSIYSLEDWPYFQRRRERFHTSLADPKNPSANIVPQVRKAIEDRGPLSSIDLEHSEKVDWWWAPTNISRAALESMYCWGELIIHHKVNTRRVFDLASRHIPKSILDAPDPNSSLEEYHDWYVLRRIGAIGLLWGKSGDAWLGMSDIKSKDRLAAITRLLQKELILEAEVEGIDTSLYLRKQDWPELEKSLAAPQISPKAAVIAPLDNLIWDRKLIQALFGFEYRWEVYKPVEEREYGYYVLPILYADRFVARFEPGWDKNAKALVIKNWWWEPGVRKTKKLQIALQQCFKQFLRFLEADHVFWDSSTEAIFDIEKRMS